MHIINFAHPLTDRYLAQIETLTAQTVDRVIDARTQFDLELPIAEQSRRMVAAINLSSNEWQTLPLLINLPALSVIAATVLAELHGRCGYFPAVLRLKPVAASTPPQYEVAEILNIQQIRDAARTER